MPSEKTRDVARVFDEWAQAGRDEGMATRHLMTAEPVLDRIQLEPGARVVDLGTGNGWAARHLRQQGHAAVGVDAARQMLRQARRLDPEVELVCADITRLPFQTDSFDAAFSMEALYYADDLGLALAEARRVLDGGATLHALVDYYEENEASHGWPELTGVEMQLLDEPGWRRAFEDAGFVDVASERVRVNAEVTADWKAVHGSLYVHGTAPG